MTISSLWRFMILIAAVLPLKCNKVIQKRTLMGFLFFLLTFQFSASATSEESKWEYVVTRNDTSYSVDMNSVRVSTGILLFWIAADNSSENILGVFHVAVKPASREFRFEEGSLYDKKTKEYTGSISVPSKWEKIGKNSPMEIIVDYIIENHERFKKSEKI